MAERAGASPGVDATLAILAKAPIPGFAKTRLVPLLGPEGASELHAILVERTLRTALESGFVSLALWCAPGKADPFFRAVAAGAPLELRDQPEGDLGARMLAAFELHLRRGPVVVVGTDCPELGPGHLARTAAALAAGADAAILPAEDGGYAAIGLRRVDPSLFAGVPWGSTSVLSETRARLRRLGWTTHEQSPVRDVDVPRDAEWLLASGLLSDGERARLAPYLGR